MRQLVHRYIQSTLYRTMSTQSYNRQQSIVEFSKQYGASALIGTFPCKPNRYDSIFDSMKITHIDTEEHTVTTELQITENMTNSYGTLHGGCTSSLIDVIGTLACLAADSERAGVSLDINISYYNAVKAGETIKCIGKVCKTGRTIAFTQVDIYRANDNVHVASGRHTKILPAPAKS